MRYPCAVHRCEREVNQGMRLCEKHLRKAEKRERRYKRLVKKLTKLPAKNRKKTRVIEAILSGTPVPKKEKKASTILRKSMLRERR